MTFIRSAAVAGALASAFGAIASAQAADLGGYKGSIKDGVPALVSQSAARFYARIDGSYAEYDTPMIIQDQRFDYLDRSIDGQWSFGGGLGYYFNKNIRMDVTYERRFETDVNGTVPPGSFTAGAGPAPGKLGLESDVVLLNAYYDFDTRSRFTPYVGVGIGWVHHDLKGGTFTNGCCNVQVADGDGNDFAAALMAGMSVNITGRGPAAGSSEGGGETARNFYLDIGYRFLYLGEVASGPASLVDNTLGTSTRVSPDPVVAEIHAHEFRVGLRYDFR